MSDETEHEGINVKLNDIAKDVKEIHSKLFGNGQEGLIVSHTKVKSKVSLLIFLVGTLWVGVIGGVIGALCKHFI